MQNITIIEGADNAAIADWLERTLSVALAREALTDKDPRHRAVVISVPGGSTPFPIFAELLTRALDFARLIAWPNDDRIVPEDHDASNTGKIRALFAPAGAHVVALSEDMGVPHFDLVWLGMGEDGHIASLFPNTDPQADDLQAVRRLTPDPLPPHAPFDRITLTLPSLLDTSELMFVIRGEDKRAVFEAAMRGEHDLPVARLLKAAAARGIPVTVFT
jgi:6-phosphogluconolactonase